MEFVTENKTEKETVVPCNYQRYVDYQRERHIRGGGIGWPGKPVGASAVSLYPNIAVELTASFYWLRTMAEFAHVSMEIMAAVIEDNEELSGVELFRLAKYWGVPVGYLWAPTLQTVDPSTNKGKKRRRYFMDLMKRAAGLKVNERELRFILNVRNALIQGRAIPYSHYRWACHYVERALEAARPKIPVRTKRGIVG